MFANAPQVSVQQPARGWLLDMVRLLQTTLDVHQVLSLFSDKCGELVPHAGVGFRPNDGGQLVNVGKRATTVCEYDLVLPGRPLGMLAFKRDTALTEPEIATLDTLISNRVHPLRNSLQHGEVLKQATQDPTTGLQNRASLQNTLARDVGLSRRHNTPLNVIICDVDRFKLVNDTYGHLVGDQVLRVIADRLEQGIRQVDVVFRFGGEEFVVILSNTGLEGAALLADRLRIEVKARPIHSEGQSEPVAVTVSAGVAQLGPDETQDAFLNRADAALYKAKNTGRNRICVAQAKDSIVVNSTSSEAEIRRPASAY